MDGFPGKGGSKSASNFILFRRAAPLHPDFAQCVCENAPRARVLLTPIFAAIKMRL
jgi:hypothetical protein